jgi:ABC-type multidrug transport system ATPase subunit
MSVGATRTATASAPDHLSDTPTLAVCTRGLTRRFGDQTAVDAVDLEVPRGAVFGFLGPNGCGKTTTIRMLLGLLSAHSGEIEVLGRPMPRDLGVVLPKVGALIEGPAFHLYLSGWDNLRRLDLCDRTADPRTSHRRIDEALARVGLTAAAGKKYRQYSLGMKQRLGLAAALLQPRELLVLDEPTNGLDPQGTREVRHLVRDLASDGTTVLVSSHLLAEIEQVATHVAIMSRGALLRQGPLADVLSEGTELVRITTPDGDRVTASLAALGLLDIRHDPAQEQVTARLGDLQVEEVVRAVVRADARVRGFVTERPDLEDLFVALTGEGFDVAR